MLQSPSVITVKTRVRRLPLRALALIDRLHVLATADGDPARFERFRYFARQFDRQHAVVERRATELDMIGRLETDLQRHAERVRQSAQAAQAMCRWCMLRA